MDFRSSVPKMEPKAKYIWIFLTITGNVIEWRWYWNVQICERKASFTEARPEQRPERKSTCSRKRKWSSVALAKYDLVLSLIPSFILPCNKYLLSGWHIQAYVEAREQTLNARLRRLEFNLLIISEKQPSALVQVLSADGIVQRKCTLDAERLSFESWPCSYEPCVLQHIS